MTRSTTFPRSSGLSWAVLAAPIVATARALVRLSASTATVQQLTRLNATSDQELARRGLDRETEIRRIIGVQAAL